MSKPVNEKVAAGPDHGAGKITLGKIIFEGEAAEIAKRQVAAIFHTAFEQQGLHVFEDPKSSAVVHEAGHAVVYACQGIELRYAKVWEQKGVQGSHWVGKVQPVEDHPFETDPHTSPEDDFKNACRLLAGRMAELLFDKENFRLASSADEATAAQLLAHNISRKTGLDPKDVAMRIGAMTASMLQQNESIVREIARLLDHDGVVGRKKLAEILANINGFREPKP